MQMTKSIRIGFIGLDTTHVSAFAKIINDANHVHHIPGARVTVAFPGGSPDFPTSINRVGGFTQELREQQGVEMLTSPEAVAEASDLVFITAVDGRVHLEIFQRTVKFGKPTFIDKPFTVNLGEAREILNLAQRSGVPMMSCSSLRYSERLSEALAQGREGICGCDVFGPMDEEATQPGLFWYGCHTVEMMVAIMGAGCREVRCVRNEGSDLLTAIWADGRMASLRGLRGAHYHFGATIHRKDAVQCVDARAGRPGYVGLIEAIMRSLPQGRSDVPANEMIDVVAIMEAANKSRQTGVTVNL
jgi:predicted dehydrogenase